MTADINHPHEIDQHVGSRVRLRRKLLGISQSELAGRIGLTFQQVQKYEKGFNRISASKLYEIARVLKCSVSDFFEGVTEGDSLYFDRELAVSEFLNTSEGLELARCFPRIGSAQLRRRILGLVSALAGNEE